MWAFPPQNSNQFGAIQIWHNNVGDEKMDSVGVAGGESERRVSAPGFEDPVAAGF